MSRQHGGHQGEHATRPRYRRIVAAGSSALVTLVAVFGAIGFIPGASSPGSVTAEAASATSVSKQSESAGSDRAGAVALSGYVAGSTPREPQNPAPVPDTTDLPASDAVPAPKPEPSPPACPRGLGWVSGSCST